MISPLPPPIGGISRWTEKFIKDMEEAYSVTITVLNIGNKSTNKKFKLVHQIIRSIKHRINFKNVLKKDTYDMCHLNTSLSYYGVQRDLYFINRIKKKKIPILVNYRCNIEDQIKNKYHLRKVIEIVQKASLNVALNQTSFDFLNRYSLKNQIISNYIDINGLQVSKKISTNIKNILFVGHFVQEKGIDLVFDLAEALPELNFYLIGSKFDYEIPTHLKNINIHYDLNKKELEEYYEKSDVFLLPTKSEGFSNAILEAMAHGIPVVTTRVGANEKMIENFGGVLIEVGNLDQAIKAFHKISNLEIRRSISDWNIQKVKGYYSKDVVLNIWYDMYNSLIEI